MRISAAVLLTTGFLVIGCGDNMTPAKLDGGQGDMAMMSSPDMAMAKTGCNGYIDCVVACPANDDACTMDCERNTKTQGSNLYDAAIACGQSYCLGLNDMGPGDCILSANQMQLLNKDMSEPFPQGGGVNGDCGRCLVNALNPLFKEPCPMTNDPDCNPAQCQSAITACHNNN
jgi:hypothetical protein